MLTKLFPIFLFAALALLVSACGPLATATPRATLTAAPATVTLPTITPTRNPATPTLIPTATPNISPTPTKPSATPTRTRAATTPARPTATATKPPAPKGSIAYHVRKDGVDRLYFANLESGTNTALLELGPSMDFAQNTNAHFAEFSPDGSKLAYIFSGQLFQPDVLTVMDLRTGIKTPIFSSEGGGGGLSGPTWSPDGKRVAVIRMAANQRNWGIHLVNADATGTQVDLRVTNQGEQYRGGISWSRQDVLTLAVNTTGASDVYKLFVDGGGFQNLTNHPADDSTPVWSPDGKQIVFTSTREGRAQIYVMNADGTGLRRVGDSPFADFSPIWAPDGNWIAFASTRENSTDVYIMDLRGTNVRRITTGGGDHPLWSR
ncbi:MAG: PD40 domain-containing protein [Chloroflexi bacterium]|nr:PD40 domain-containing protein [Chloroflexota bacterium]